MRKRFLYHNAIDPRFMRYPPNFNDDLPPHLSYSLPPEFESSPPPFTQYAKPEQPDEWYQAYQEMANGSPSFPYVNGGDVYGYNETGEIPPFATMANPPATENDTSSFQQKDFVDMNETMPTPPSDHNQPNGILSQFQNADGQMDIDKMLNTVGQLANTYHQVAPIIKQFGSFMKTFR